MKYPLALLLFSILFLACNQENNQADFAERPQARQAHLPDSVFQSLFSERGVVGTFVLHEMPADHWTVYNPDRADTAIIPASTFKIPNSLIALETGVIKDEMEIIPWDGKERQIKSWNQDHNLRSAIKNSAVWFYQELARQVGKERMQHWVDTFAYGNQDISGGIDLFWLNGGIRIRPREQIRFLEKLYYEQVPCSKRNIEIVKDIMLIEETEDYALHAKTGWTGRTNPSQGWYVGWLEHGERVYFFAMNMTIEENSDTKFRHEITMEVLDRVMDIE